mmetsp:Transcript_21208/g.21614  ORF Transcript_21208/g.21614 Transcript_21208/m.21614 type:complete len:284 (+) Transcript_21208:174-1025(+)
MTIMLPLLITTATVAYAVIFPNERKKGSKAATPSSSFSSTNVNIFFLNSFWIGVGCGLSFSWLVSYEIKRRRLWQHARLHFLSWLYNFNYESYHGNKTDGDQELSQRMPLLQKFRKPVSISELKGTLIPRSKSDNDDENYNGDVCGSRHLELVSPDWALSSNLYCDILTLLPRTELMSKKTNVVEFYYVIEGDGIYNRNGGKHRISTGFGFIVDPECTRGFVVGGTSNLVLLRATDIALSDRKNDIIKLQTSSLSSTVAIARAGMNKVYQLIESRRTNSMCNQ